VHKTDEHEGSNVIITSASSVLLFAFIIESRPILVHGYRCGSTASDADVERVMRDWLRTAADRSGGRRRRDVCTAPATADLHNTSALSQHHMSSASDTE